MSFRIVSLKKRFIFGVGVVLLLIAILAVGYVHMKPRHYSRVISVDVYADTAEEGLAFYEAIPDENCVNVITEHVSRSATKKPAAEVNAAKAGDKKSVAVESPLVYAAAPKCSAAISLPTDYKKLGKEGYVGLVLNLNEEGKIARGEIDKTSGFKELDEAALKQVTETWSFEPCKKADKAIACRQTIKFRWKDK